MKTCARCKKELEEDSPEDLREMKEELEKDFPGCTLEECDIICDDCYVKFQAWKEKFEGEFQRLKEKFEQERTN